MFSFARNSQVVFKGAAPPCVSVGSDKSPCCSAPSPAFGVVNVLEFGHSSCVVVFHFCFKLNFSDDVMWSIFSFAYFPSVFSSLGCVKIFGLFLHQDVSFLIVEI